MIMLHFLESSEHILCNKPPTIAVAKALVPTLSLYLSFLAQHKFNFISFGFHLFGDCVVLLLLLGAL